MYTSSPYSVDVHAFATAYFNQDVTLTFDLEPPNSNQYGHH